MKRVFVCIPLLLFVVSPGMAQTSVIDSLQKIVDRHPGDTVGALALDNISGEYMRKDMEKAKYYAHLTLKLSRSLGYDNGMSRAYATLIPMFQSTGPLDSTLYYINEYEKFYKKKKSSRVGINYNNTTGLFYKNQGKYAEALPFLEEALRLIGPNGNKLNRAGQMLNIGNVYSLLGNLPMAANYHLKSLVLFEKIGNKRGQSFCLQGLGTDYYNLDQYSTAEKYYFRSAKMKEELGDRRGLVTTWQNLGNVYQRLHKPELSAQYSTKALNLARELNLSFDQKEILFNLGSLMRGQKKFEEARKAFNESMELSKKGGDSLTAARIRSELVMMASDISKEKNEEKLLIENIKIALENGAKSHTADGYYKLAEWYAGHKQFDKAYDYLRQAKALSDTVQGNEIIVQLKRLEEEYKNEKKEKEIALLKKDQELSALALGQQKAVNTSIIIALVGIVVIGILLINRYRVLNKARRMVEIERVRNTIARDLHDDIGSTLSSINILSKIALVEKNGSAENYLQRIGDQSSRMMEDISDIVWSINPHNDSMNQAVIRMREFSSEVLESKNISLNFSEKINDEIKLDADKRKNLFLIFKESVNNAAKYSNATNVAVRLEKEGHVLVMNVKDNGQGFDESTVRAGNGLRNLRERAHEINATINLRSQPGNGTEIELRLPLA
jgi:two-component system, NarL family, sensor histidine kinase UhpB